MHKSLNWGTNDKLEELKGGLQVARSEYREMSLERKAGDYAGH